MKRYEVLFMDGHTEILDFESVDHLIDELEGFERFDVNQIHLLKDDGDFDTVWTEEEGCFVPDFGYPTRDDVDDEDYDDEF